MLRLLSAILLTSLIPFSLEAVLVIKRPGAEDPGNLVGWWISTENVYNTGTTLATNGQTVDGFEDKTTGKEVTQTTSGSRPTFQTNELNGRPGILFDENNDFLELGSALITGTPCTIYVLCERNNITASSQIIVSAVNTGSSGDWIDARTQDGGFVSYQVRDSGADAKPATSSSGWSINTPVLITGISASATDHKVYADDGDEGTSIENGAPSGINEFIMGQIGDSSPDGHWGGYLYSVRVYDVAHTSAQKTQVAEEMNSRFGRNP